MALLWASDLVTDACQALAVGVCGLRGPDDHTTMASRDLHGGLVGLQGQQALVGFDAVADLDEQLDDFTFTAPLNPPGGELTGLEANYTQPFTFLPGKWSNLGTQLNYTYVDSDIQYLLSSGATAQKWMAAQ